MKISLYLDEDSMDHALVHGLRARGVDVATALDAGLIEQPDEKHLAHATSQGRVLCSFNVADFAAIHSRWLSMGQHHAGLVLAFQQQLRKGEQLRRLLRLVATLTRDQMIDRLEYLTAWA